ncbi:MAG: transglutaminase domain-containing protein [Eubacterium sp.]|nr:transglutaminase domain-containing protein [Eubacterium sp.]
MHKRVFAKSNMRKRSSGSPEKRQTGFVLRALFLNILILSFVFSACGESKQAADTKGTAQPAQAASGDPVELDGRAGEGGRITITDPLQTQVLPENASENNAGTAAADMSFVSDGYVSVCYDGPSEKVQLQITNPDGTVCPYPLKIGSFEAFPLTAGDGTYQLNVLENISGDKYAIILSEVFDVTLDNEFSPFLYPNEYVQFTQDSTVMQKGISFSDESSDDLDYVRRIYDYVINTIGYDFELAMSAPTNYIPDVEATLESGMGICFDYAAVMSAFCRSQGIPTRLEVGYAGESYHAWISVYLQEQGWVDDMIEFDGNTWTLMDPTLRASNDKDAVKEFMGDGSSYMVKYYY